MCDPSLLARLLGSVQTLPVDFDFYDDGLDVSRVFAIRPVAFTWHPGAALAASLSFSPCFVRVILADPTEA